MNKKNVAILSVLMLLVNLSTRAQNISGYWQGVSYQNSGGPSTYYPASLQITQNGTAITATGTSRLPNGSPSYAIFAMTGTFILDTFRYSTLKIIQQVAPPFPYYWCSNGTGVLVYDNVAQTLFGPSNSPGCAGVGRGEYWRLAIVSDTIFCRGTPVLLSVTGQNIRWYSNSTLTQLIGTGNTITPAVTASTTLYVTQTHYNTESPAVPVSVIIRAPIQSSLSQTICQGQSFNGHTASGTFVDTLHAASGCDTVRTLTLTVRARSFSAVSRTICEGESFLGHTSSGTFSDTLQSYTGCDSVRTLTLVVLPKPRLSLNQTICQGQSLLGHKTSGVYIDTFHTANGCDSIRTLTLTVVQRLFSYLNQTICEGQSFAGHQASGVYTDTLRSAFGCDSIRQLTLTVTPRSSSIINKTICPGESFMGYNQPGIYNDTLKTVAGCDSIRTINLTIAALPAPDLTGQDIICGGQSISLYPGAFTTYLWQDGSVRDHLAVTSAGLYSVTVSNACGTKTASVQVTEQNCQPEFPNAFSPNGDGKNDVFRIIRPYNLKDYRLAVYNRFGQRLFETKDPLTGWDGTVNGKLQDPSLFIWTCQFTRNNMTTKLRGTMLILR